MGRSGRGLRHRGAGLELSRSGRVTRQRLLHRRIGRFGRRAIETRGRSAQPTGDRRRHGRAWDRDRTPSARQCGPWAAFDLAHSTYAIYYAANPTLVLDAMRAALKPAGRLAVCVPAPGHGLVRFMDSFIALPEEVRAGDAFAPDVLQPYFDSHFSSVTAQKLRNVVRIPSVAEVMGFLSHTSYYAEAVRAPVEAAIEARIRAHGHFEYEKNSVLLIGRNG